MAWPDVPLTDREIDRIAAFAVPANVDCDHWIGSADDHGYARCWFRGRNWHAARLVLQVKLGRVLRRGEQVDHLCRNRRCINPEHLEPVSAAENRRRAWERAAAWELMQGGLSWDEAAD